MTTLTAKEGHNGNPPELHHPRDLDGRGLRELEPQVWRFDVLDRLLKQQTIEPHHFQAGRKLQHDWEMASKIPCCIASQMGGQARGSVTPADAKLAAAMRYGRAMASLSPAAVELIAAVVIRNEPIIFAARDRKVDHRAFTGAFVVAIDQLAQHYGLTT